MGYFFVFLNIITVTAAQILIKIGTTNLNISDGFNTFTSLFNIYIYLSILLSGFAILTWFGALSKLSLGQAYPLLSLTFPLVLLASSMIFNEKIISIQWIGMLIMLFGLFLICRP